MQIKINIVHDFGQLFFNRSIFFSPELGYELILRKNPMYKNSIGIKAMSEKIQAGFKPA